MFFEIRFKKQNKIKASARRKLGQNAVFEFPNGKFKGVWWMPWLEEAMKDAVYERISGRSLTTFDPEVSEWGNPTK